MFKKSAIIGALILAMAAPTPFVAAQAVPSGENMLIRLETPLSTEDNRVGDPFSATVVEPARYEGALVKGHIRNIDESGRLSGRTELSLDFDSIALRRGDVTPFRAQVTDVRDTEDVKIVDNEGKLRSGSRTTDTLTRSGIGGAVGGVLGGVLGGGKGALIGVLLGAGAGAGSLFAQGAREIRLDPGALIDISTGFSSRSRSLARSDEYDRNRDNRTSDRYNDRRLARTDYEQDPAFVQDVQNALQTEGYDPGARDGRIGWRTREAIRDFQRDQGLPVTGSIDQVTADRLGVRW